MATHSGSLAWRIPWTEEPGGLQSLGSQSQTRLKPVSMQRRFIMGIDSHSFGRLSMPQMLSGIPQMLSAGWLTRRTECLSPQERGLFRGGRG